MASRQKTPAEILKLDAFLKKCREAARSRKTFKTKFTVQVNHVTKRGQDQNSSIRYAITDEHMASVILHGTLDYADCEMKPTTIAVDGVFSDFRYVEFLKTGTAREVQIEKLSVRVVVREGYSALIIVTIYTGKKAPEQLKEVPNEVWK